MELSSAAFQEYRAFSKSFLSPLIVVESFLSDFMNLEVSCRWSRVPKSSPFIAFSNLRVSSISFLTILLFFFPNFPNVLMGFCLATLPFFIFLPRNVSMKPSDKDICSFLISSAYGKRIAISSSSRSSKCVALVLESSASFSCHFSDTSLHASLILLHLRISWCNSCILARCVYGS